MIRAGAHVAAHGQWPEGAVAPRPARARPPVALAGVLHAPAPKPDEDLTIVPERILAVRCWCFRATVQVPAREIRAGRTASCGTRKCRP